MSDSESRLKKSKRRAATNTAAKKQYSIAKSHGMNPDPNKMHRYAKMHSLNCGDPNCMMCGNPRKFFNEITMQEKKFIDGVDFGDKDD